MSKKQLSAVLVVAGLALVALSVAADAIGIGGDYVFGWEQKLGVAVGMTLAWFSGLNLLGWYARRVRRAAPVKSSSLPQPHRPDASRAAA